MLHEAQERRRADEGRDENYKKKKKMRTPE
jgi:hypothetical protein